MSPSIPTKHRSSGGAILEGGLGSGGFAVVGSARRGMWLLVLLCSLVAVSASAAASGATPSTSGPGRLTGGVSSTPGAGVTPPSPTPRPTPAPTPPPLPTSPPTPSPPPPSTAPGSTTAAAAPASASISATEGAAFSGQVAALSAQCANPDNPQATIAWGDGRPASNASVTGSGSQLLFNGSTTYPEEGGFTGTVTGSYTCPGALAPSTVTFSAALDATVADALLTITAAPTASAAVTAGRAFSGEIAAFSDADPSGVAGDYAALIDWGDGSASSGTVVASGNSWAIAGQHVYATAGSYAVGVRIDDRGGASVTAKAFVQVAPGPARIGLRVEPHVGNGTAVLSLDLTRPGLLTISPVRRHHRLLIAGRSIRVGKAGPLVVVLKPTAAASGAQARVRAQDARVKIKFNPFMGGPSITQWATIIVDDLVYCGSITYYYTGAEQSCVVPNGVHTVDVIAVGARGGNVSVPCQQDDPDRNCATGNWGGTGGQGALVISPEVPVTPGQTLYIEVGGNGGDTYAWGQSASGPSCCFTGHAGAGGWNGGGPGQMPSSWEGSAGGGGASDVQTLSCAQLCDQGLGFGAFVALGSRLVVAGGGGGGGSGGPAYGDNQFSWGGNGGNAFWNGENGDGADFNHWTNLEGLLPGEGGLGALEDSGGSGGESCRDRGGLNEGADGKPGIGGAGGVNTGADLLANGPILGYAGGGGGGGRAGGGGGGGGCFSDDLNVGGGGGGGAGSSYGPPGTSASVNVGAPPQVYINPVG